MTQNKRIMLGDPWRPSHVILQGTFFEEYPMFELFIHSGFSVKLDVHTANCITIEVETFYVTFSTGRTYTSNVM